jgi:cobalt-zinc-cadmium resistance protein CzcA
MMLARLVEFSLAQRALVLAGAALLVLLGIEAWRGLPIDAFPEISSTQVKLILKAPGMTPEEVEARIAAPIEMEMLGIPGQTMLRSVSKYALTDITIDFADGTDIYWARQQAAERLSAVMADLPGGVTGGLAPITTPLGEMFMFTIEGGGLDLAERRALLDWVIRPQLRTLPGVADVNALGGFVKAFEVAPDNARMSARGITLEQLASAIERNNRNDGAGRLKEGEEVWLVRVEGAVRGLNDLADIVIAEVDGVPVRVGEVAEVRLGSLTRYGAVTRNGAGEAVQGLVLGLRGANASQVVEGVKARLAEIEKTLPKGVKIVPFYDRGALVERAVGTVMEALAEAIALVLVLLMLFLGNLRAAATVAIILPLSALATFLLMNVFGLTANLMSLGGLAIAIGMLVDAAVVVVENIAAHLAHDTHAGRYPRLHLIYRAASEVTAPVVSGIVIIAIVFLPLLSLQGLEGKLFRPVALTIVFALLSSLLLALTVIPAAASLLLKPDAHGEPWLPRRALALYAPWLARALARPRPVLIAAVLLLVAAGAVFPRIGKTFMPTLDEGDLIVQLEKLPSIGLEASAATDLAVQRALLARVPEIAGIVARAGSDELGLDPMGLNQTDSFLVLKPRDQWRHPDKDRIMDAVREVMEDFPGLDYAFTQPIDMRVSEMIVGARGDLALKIFGADLATLNRLAGEAEAILTATPGAQDVFSLKNDGVQYLSVRVDRLAAGRLGLDADTLSRALRVQLEGQRAGLVAEGARRVPILLRGDTALRESPALFEAQRIVLPDGRAVPLASVARIERVEGPVAISREQAARYVSVQSNVAGRDLVSFVEDARQRIEAKLDLPTGYRLQWGGEFENQQRAMQRLMLVVPIALALIFVLLFVTFRSVRQAALVLSNIPFALVGGVFALWASGEYLSVPASVGFIALLGIAVLNGVVMVTYFNQLREQGMALDDVVREGAHRRLRPVLMTATIAAFGLLPLLAASGPGSEIQRPLAIVVIGGLVTSTLLTLILLPILYRRFGVARQAATLPEEIPA